MFYSIDRFEGDWAILIADESGEGINEICERGEKKYLGIF